MCEVNHAFVEGIVRGLGTTVLRSSLTDVRDDAACLLIHTVAIDDLGGLSDSPREEYLLL